MNKFVKTLLITLAANIAGGLLFFIPIATAHGEDGLVWLVLGLVVMGLALLIQLVVGLIFLANEQRRELGKGMAVAVGLILLIGLSICGTMMVGT